MGLDVTEIAGNLFMGSAPTDGGELTRRGFNTVVLSAEEFQPPDFWFGGIEVVRAPMHDTKPARDEVLLAHQAGHLVADRIRTGRKVLVTCFAGRNRSGWITALALIELGIHPMAAIEHIRSRRAMALSNHAFNNDILRSTARSL